MKIKCPNCVAALEFDAISGKMKCDFCGGFFTMEDVANQEAKAEQKAEQEPRNKVQEPEKPVAPNYDETTGADANAAAEADNAAESDTMQCNVYACTSCGAELSVNGVETSTFCAYCGQPTIVFSRVSQALKPKLIIPFRVQKQQAIAAIRQRFNQGFFVPKEIKDFEVERVRGIYIPYWLYDSYYYDKQLIKGTVGSGKNSRTKYFMREAECHFSNLSLDASSNLNDESSQRLEPYDMRDLKPFEVAYMSGFYSDRYDMSNEDLRSLASQRTKEMFDEQTMNSCSARSKSIVSNTPKMQIQKETYAMFPAWFMTFRYQDKPYTMLVNGQTGKLVGAVPYDKKKVKSVAVAIFLLAALVCIPLAIGLFTSALADMEDFFDLIIGVVIAMVAMGSVGLSNLSRLRKSESLTSSQKINKFAHNRQEQAGGNM